MNITIRPGTPKDFPSVIKLIKELAEFERAPEKVSNSLEQIQQEQQYFDFYVAEKEGEIVGQAIYFYAYYTWVGKSLYLDDIYIKPEFRGSKIGTRLMKKVFEKAKEQNCKRIRWQVLDWNTPAAEFYQKIGGSISKEWLTVDFHNPEISAFLAS